MNTRHNKPLMDFPPTNIFLEPGALKDAVSDESTYARIVEAAKQHTEYTAVIIIARQVDGALKFLCPDKDSFLLHCPLQPDETITEGIINVRNKICDAFEIEDINIIDVTPLDPEPMFTVKIIYQTIKSVALVLYTVQLDESVKEKVVEREKVWKTIDEMTDDPKAMKSNYDVIERLGYKRNYLRDSFVPKSGTLHVIWNITNRCSAGCKICATSDSRRIELWPEEKLSILNALATEKRRIKSIDFAGGDPCQDENSLQIIKNAVQIFGESIVSVTTTSKGLSCVPNNARKSILNSCELTFDASKPFLSTDKEETSIRGIKNYSSSNMEAIKYAADVLRRVTINIPILDDDLTEDEIKELADRIEKIKTTYKHLVVSAALIRLMPVGSHGAAVSTEEYKNYHPIDTAQKIYKALKDRGILCKYHCSLRILDQIQEAEDNACTMLDRKIGIDCAGNVFACAWGGYLHIGQDVTQNPFYIGNLLKNSLSEILSSNNSCPAYRRIRNKNDSALKRNYCEVVSRFIKLDSDENNDPLAIEDDRS